MFLASDKSTALEELLSLVNQRALQIIILCLISMATCQIYKCIWLSIKKKRFIYQALFTTGGFPSSHTSTCMTLVTSLFLFQLHDLDGRIDWSFAVAVIFSMIIIHDAMGVRFEASKHAKILNNLTSDMDIEEKQSIGFGKKGFLKEMLGHRGIEVFGGAILGIIIGVIGYFIYVDLV